MTGNLRIFGRDNRGVAAIEFALLAPVLIMLLLGIFQVGFGMHAHNALRALSMDTARYVVVEYQKKKTLTNSQIATWAKDRAASGPYVLISSRLTTSVTSAATPRISGTTERTLTINYSVPSTLGFIGIKDIPLSYSRTIFLPA